MEILLILITVFWGDPLHFVPLIFCASFASPWSWLSFQDGALTFSKYAGVHSGLYSSTLREKVRVSCAPRRGEAGDMAVLTSLRICYSHQQA